MVKTIFNYWCVICCCAALRGQAPPPSYKLEKPAGPEVDSVLASVNGEPITLVDVLYESSYSEARLYAVYSSKDIFRQIQSLRRQILDEIVDRKLILLDYEARKPFEVPRQYVENLIDELAMNYGCRDRSELREKVREAGTSLEELREKARTKVITQIMISNYIYTVVNLTPREIHDYYQVHIKDFSTPPQIRLQLLLIAKDNQDAERIKKELREAFKKTDPNVFTGMVRLYSSGPGAMRGGDLGWIECPELRPEFAQAIKDRKTGAIVGPIATDEGTYFLRINGRKAANKAAFTQMIPQIKEQMEARRRKAAYDKYVAQLREKSVIRYF
ncbi:MAG: peptidyl-prolyl cis-trans isomerase [Victivallaceae bacterium]|nr:peptidyl-prolyl cis-trans isomerase [Victivallaceae bacterium]